MRKLRDYILFHLAILLGPWLIGLLGRTWRIERFGEEHHPGSAGKRRNVIYAFWHGRLLPLTFTHRNQRIQILISRHSDGEIIRRITDKLGFGSVRGSTGKGGGRAILQMVRKGKEGLDLAITPDGPRGPREKAQGGVVRIAQRSGLLVLPLSSASSRGWILKSWDRFRIPAPFARVAVGYGPPIAVPRELTSEGAEALRDEVERGIARCTEEADRRAGASEVK
jgi:lysophospholipid acyltransferase (LPLAT)-like uncharacterized protein